MKKQSHIMPFCLIVPVILIGLILVDGTTPAQAARAVFHGAELDLSAPCAQVHIKIDPTLKDGITVEETSGPLPAPSPSDTNAGGRLSMALPHCTKGNKAVLSLSPGTTLTLHDSPNATINIAGTLSALDGTLQDSVLEITRVQSLDLSLRGSSRGIIHQLDRAAQIITANTASLTINEADMSIFSAKVGDNSQLAILHGQIETLTLAAGGQARARILAQSSTATVTTSDQADVTLGHVQHTLNHSGTTTLHRIETTASATVQQTAATAPPAPVPTIQADGAAQGLNTSAPAVMTLPPASGTTAPLPPSHSLTHDPVTSHTTPETAKPTPSQPAPSHPDTSKTEPSYKAP